MNKIELCCLVAIAIITIPLIFTAWVIVYSVSLLLTPVLDSLFGRLP